jgi:hypothetical protein
VKETLCTVPSVAERWRMVRRFARIADSGSQPLLGHRLRQ